jgi:serine/threonine protein kinase
MTGRLKPSLWIVPLVIAGLVALFGWWGDTRLRQTIEGQLRAELTATLNANVMALEIWMTNQTRLAAFVAEEPKVRTLALGLLEKSDRLGTDAKEAPDPSELGEFNNYLRQRLNKVSYDAAQLVKMVNTNFVIVANAGPPRARLVGTPVSEAHHAKFAELFSSGQPVLITPYKPEPPSGRRPPPRAGVSGQLQSGRPFDNRTPFRPRGTNGFPRGGGPPFPEGGRGRRGDFTLMQVAAPVRDDSSVVRGALALIINPDREFTRMLSVARSGQSGETYAFDQHGLLISRSRFDEQLRKLGLLDATNASSALNLRLHDPGGDLTEGFKPADGDSATRPLTRIVANAVTGADGVDVEPSRDYRGVPVVGAWRWLRHQGFGIATQIDATEAYQPLRVLKLLFVLLFVLLVLCATGMFLFSYRNVVWRRRLSAAELKVKQLGQYTLEEKIGEGGMGVVYRARHALMRRETAVKLLLPGRADPASIRRFEREVCLTCQLTHPNTIQVYDYGHTPEGIFYYAMEYLRGLNLNELVTRFGPQSEARVIHILGQVCDALAEAHALGLVHRDIKPANVFLCNRGGVPDCVKVLDFGLVREYRDRSDDRMHLTGEKAMVGTPSFMPPESIKNPARSDPRSDIYSVGALGYYLLTGENVFAAESILDLYEKHLTESPVPPSQRTGLSLSAELEGTILRCLEKDPNLRPQSVSELRALLLRSPHATEWGPEARAAWWASYHSDTKRTQTESHHRDSDPIEATVKIDFASRMP